MIVEMEMNMNLGYFLQPFTDNRDVSILERGETKFFAENFRKKYHKLSKIAFLFEEGIFLFHI